MRGWCVPKSYGRQLSYLMFDEVNRLGKRSLEKDWVDFIDVSTASAAVILRVK